MARRGLTVTRSGYGLQRSAGSGQELADRAGRGRNWGLSYHELSVHDRTHRRVQSVDADQEKHLERREECVERFWSQQPSEPLHRGGWRMWRRADEAFARSEKHDRIRENELR